MSELKKLGKQTAIYGIPTIVGRFLNYLLVPFYSRVMLPAEYGIVTDLYAYVALLGMLLTYGFETAFFRYSQKQENKDELYNTAFLSILLTTSIFLGLCLLFNNNICEWLNYKNFNEYIIIFAIILSLDTLRAIPFALLRQQEKSGRFAFIKSVDILSNLGFNFFFLLLCPFILNQTTDQNFLHQAVDTIYNPHNKVQYVFLSNLFSSIISFLLLSPQILKVRFKVNKQLWQSMLIYAFPILLGSLAGSINEVFDRIALKYLIPPEQNPMAQLGIYGACYKLSIIMSLMIQAFRFAAEPFFFKKMKDGDARQTYADVTKYFVIICTIAFLGVTLYLEPISILFLGVAFREGITVVPILLMANLFLGVYYNLSIWYKVNDKTIWGAYIGLFGAAITLVLNFALVPVMGYIGAAWATLTCYFSIAVISYFIGQRKYPVPYNVKNSLFYILLALAIYGIATYIPINHVVLRYTINTVLFVGFIGLAYIYDFKRVLKVKR